MFAKPMQSRMVWVAFLCRGHGPFEELAELCVVVTLMARLVDGGDKIVRPMASKVARSRGLLGIAAVTAIAVTVPIITVVIATVVVAVVLALIIPAFFVASRWAIEPRRSAQVFSMV